MKLVLVNRARAAVNARWVQSFLRRLARRLEERRVWRKANQYELVVVFVSAPEMRRLNNQYRGKDYATDVLSFGGVAESEWGAVPGEDFGGPVGARGVPLALGELVLCAPVLRRQAREHGLTFEEELGYMLIHGVLHLLGYDHERSEREARRMFKLQDALFAELFVR